MLKLEAKNGREISVDLNANRLNIGRDAANDLVLESESVSGFHATLFCEEGLVELIDVGSTNGTLVNGSRISGRQPLKAWDCVRFGDYEFEVVDTSGRRPTRVQPAIGAESPTPEKPATPAELKSAETPLAILRALAAGTSPATFTVTKSVTIGRADGNQLQLASPTVSSRHAEIQIRGTLIELVDLGSTNGTWVNDTRIQRQVLGHGDRIRFDEIEFRVELSHSATKTQVNPAIKPAVAATQVNRAIISPEAQPAPHQVENKKTSVSQDAAVVATGMTDVLPAEQPLSPPPPLPSPKQGEWQKDFDFSAEDQRSHQRQKFSQLLFSFEGRVGRLKYFVVVLALAMITMLISALAQFLFLGEIAAYEPYSTYYFKGMLIQWLCGLMTLWPVMAVAVKRIHDQNRSAHWLWLFLVPFVNLVIGIMLLFVPGTSGINRFGEPDA